MKSMISSGKSGIREWVISARISAQVNLLHGLGNGLLHGLVQGFIQGLVQGLVYHNLRVNFLGTRYPFEKE